MSEHAIAPGMVVTVNVVMKDDAGTVISATEADRPLTYLQGSGVLVPGLEARLDGEQAGVERHYVVPPAEAFGEKDPRLLKATPLANLPVAEPRVGMRLATRDADGELTPMTIVAIKDDTVLLDLNPRLAGATLHFDVEVLAVRPATDAELEANTALS